MLVCHCRVVTERTVRAAIASGAASVGEVSRRCGAGARCGGCWPALAALLAEAPVDRTRSATSAA